MVRQPEARRIKDEAAAFVAKGRWRKALDAYRILERLEPGDGTWPQRAGEMHRRLGEAAAGADALTRAADLYSRQGFLLKAIAVCKMILELDPRRTEVEERLAALHAARFATQRPAGVIRAVVAPELPLPEAAAAGMADVPRPHLPGDHHDPPAGPRAPRHPRRGTSPPA
jgi:cAMP-dependent protein kinase regulator